MCQVWLQVMPQPHGSATSDWCLASDELMVALTTGLQWCLLDGTIYSVWPTNGSESVGGASTARVRLGGMV